MNHQHLTAALIDSRDFLAAKRRVETEVMLPAGPKVALTGGTDFNDHRLIWGKLDQVRTKYPDMVLLHGGGGKGAELIAAKWAEARGVTQVAFKPDWTNLCAGPLFLIWCRPTVGGLMVLFGVVSQLPFIAIQRFNRARLQRVLTRCKHRQRAHR